MERKRITWIDCAKGLAILLVIVGHTVRGGRFGSLARGLIFSFHMPLFFVLSSLTFRYSENSEELICKTKKAAKHLLLPVLAVTGITVLWELVREPGLLQDLNYWRDSVFRLLVGSGVEQSFGSLAVPPLGIPWFFFALFFGRTLYDYLQLEVKGPQLCIAVWVISTIGVAIGMVGGWLPLSLDIALAILPFFWFGEELKTRWKPMALSAKKVVFITAIWLAAFWLTYPVNREWTYLELAVRRYPLHPVGFLCAVFGTLVFCKAGILLSGMKGTEYVFSWLGRNSMYLLLIHHLDGMTAPLWNLDRNQFLVSVCRIAVDLCVTVLFVNAKRFVPFLWKKKRKS